MFIQNETQLDPEKVREDKPTGQTFLCLVHAHTLSHLSHTQSRCLLVPLYTPTPEAGALISALYREQDQARDAIDSNSSWHARVARL